MSDHERVSEVNDEETIDESGRNLTQQRMDEEGVEDAPVDAGWDNDDDKEGVE